MTLQELDFSREISKNDLLEALKNEANQVHINDFMKTCSFLKKSMEHVHPHYQEEYIKMYTEGYLKGYRDVKNDKRPYRGYLNSEELAEAVKLLESQEELMKKEFGDDRSFKPYLVLSLYTTFILEEPVHPVGTPFPGGLKVRKDEGIYYCPVKDNNEDNPLAVCGFCLAQQEPDM
ncbi:DUF2115 domain-containing protein [Methanobacterium formicicum]|jgi:uncharacterized protein (UPF0305 family)|uniref:DUF2115 domain-containing protein n=1 Tax=Methanobacterium formicicum TaxID=2162 RepID=UPI002FE091FA